MREGKLGLWLQYSLQTCLYILDVILSLIVIPISAVVAWTTIYYVVEKITDDFWRITLIVSCALIHSLNHLCCKFIYRFIVEYVTGRKTFFVVSKIYLYVFAFASTVIYGVVPEDHLEQLPYAESPFHNIVLVVISFATLLTIRCRPHIDFFGKDCGGESTPEEVFLFPFRFFSFSVLYKIYNYEWQDYVEGWGLEMLEFMAVDNILIDVRKIIMRASVVVGIDPESYVGHRKLYKCLTVLDILFSSLIVAPLVIVYWCSTWSTLLFVKISSHQLANLLITVLYSFCVLILFTVFQRHIQVSLTEYVGNRFLYALSSRLYTEIFGIASVSSWFGVWKAVDFFTGSTIIMTVAIVTMSYVGLACTKTVRNLTGPPFAIITDKEQGYFDVPTLFQKSYNWKKNKLLYVLDSIFSVFIVGTLVILVWRGAWCLLDQAIYPEDYELSGWISLAIGYLIVLVTFLSQSFMKWLLRREDGWKRLVILDVYVVISFCGTVNIWRGIWILLEVHTDLENSLRNCILLHFLSFFILVIFNASNTLLVRGVYMDAEESIEECVEFPCYYFRSKYQEMQKNKAIAQLNRVESEIKKIGRVKDDCSVTHDQVTRYIDQDFEDATGKRFSNNLVGDKIFELQSKEASQNVPVLISTPVVMESNKCIND